VATGGDPLRRHRAGGNLVETMNEVNQRYPAQTVDIADDSIRFHGED
jgi:hypothetical protein